MNHNLIREKFRKFFESRGHTWVPSSSLLPDDPSVLFTTAGMQQFKSYYLGEPSPYGNRVVSIQKSMRTSDIDEVGDESHLTFFEMLGNFCFAGLTKITANNVNPTAYWKKEAIEYAHKFITEEMGLNISYVTVFEGSNVVPKDEESKRIWQDLGVVDVREEGMEDVFWGPTGNSGPCGSTTEIYVKNAKGQDIEIWNIVFNEFNCDGSREQLLRNEAKLIQLDQTGIDTGMGLERLAMVVQKKENIFETDLFESIIKAIPSAGTDIRRKRIVADHARASFFLISDGVRPSNKERGYILRRLLRRIIVQAHLWEGGSFQGMDTLSIGRFNDINRIYEVIAENYSHLYSELDLEKVKMVFKEEFNQFNKTFKQGLKEIKFQDNITASIAFNLYGTFGITFEILKDVGGDKVKNLKREDFEKEFEKHQEKSRAGLEKKFGGHGLLLDTGELKAANEEELKIVTRLHTATHLLQATLRKVLGKEVHQAGSDITVERTRFDFTFPRKLTPEEIKQVEDLVNDVISRDLTVDKQTLSREEAEKTGALHFFKIKYPEQVDVYTVGGDPDDPVGADWFSKEFCGGPHVTHSGEIGHFKIVKEEASSAGVRRIRAIVR